MLSLQLFGGLALHGSEGPIAGRVTQRRRLALLAVLAVERRLVSRDKLLGLFWPDADSERGRRLLADSLYVLRSGLGEALATPGDDVRLNDSQMVSDLGLFLGAIDDGRLEDASRLYTGPFLEGVFISDAPEFERWAESVRSRLAGEHRRILEALAVDADKREGHDRAIACWRRLATADPLSTRAALGLMRALARAGDRAAALQYARVHEELVRGELDAGPDPAIAALAAQLRTAPASAGDSPPVILAPAMVPDVVAPPSVERVGRTTRWRLLAAASFAVIVVAVATEIMLRSRDQDVPSPGVSLSATPRSTDADSLPRIAVLPFDPISTNQDAEYVAGGITEALIAALDRLHRMHVISRTSAAAAKRAGLSAKAVGDTLGARFLIEGSVRLAGSHLLITPTLTDARDGTILWSDTLQREYTAEQIIGVEAAVVRSIASALDMRLSNPAAASLIARTTTNTEASILYQKGRRFWDSRNPAGVHKAIDAFERAIAKDPKYAEAYVGLADAYATIGIGNIGDFRADEYFPKVAAAAMRALDLDSTLAEAHASLGYMELLYKLDWAAASRELSIALNFRPSYSTARIYRAILFEWTMHFGEAVSEMQRALKDDPLSLASNAELGRALFLAGRHEEAATQLRATLDLDSTSFRAHTYLGQVYVKQLKSSEGIRELRRARELAPNSSRPLALLAYAYARAGRRAEAESLLDSLRGRERHGYVPAFDFAIAYVALDSTTRAFEWLNKSIDDHSIRPYLVDPTFERLHADARYKALLGRLKLRWRQTTGE